MRVLSIWRMWLISVKTRLVKDAGRRRNWRTTAHGVTAAILALLVGLAVLGPADLARTAWAAYTGWQDVTVNGCGLELSTVDGTTLTGTVPTYPSIWMSPDTAYVVTYDAPWPASAMVSFNGQAYTVTGYQTYSSFGGFGWNCPAAPSGHYYYFNQLSSAAVGGKTANFAVPHGVYLWGIVVRKAGWADNGWAPNPLYSTAGTFKSGTTQLPPSGLTISNITTSSADASWTAAPGATRYQVSLDGQVLGTTSSTSYHISGLMPDSPHIVSVVATSSYGQSIPVFTNFKTILAVQTAKAQTTVSGWIVVSDQSPHSVQIRLGSNGFPVELDSNGDLVGLTSAFSPGTRVTVNGTYTETAGAGIVAWRISPSPFTAGQVITVSW